MIKLPEPYGQIIKFSGPMGLKPGTPIVWEGYTADQLKQAIRDALEEAAKKCESQWSNVAEKMYGAEIAAVIRALKDSPPPTA